MCADACIWQSAFNILQSQENLEKLFEALDLVECQTDDLVIEVRNADDAEDEFIQPVRNAFYAIRRPSLGNRRIVGRITLAIQLTCEEGGELDWEFGKRAKALVGYSENPGMSYAWKFHAGEPNSAGYVENCRAEGTFWRFYEDDEQANDWFYAIPLDELTSTGSVRRLIVDPLHNILRSDNPQNPAGELTRIERHLCRPPQI